MNLSDQKRLIVLWAILLLLSFPLHVQAQSTNILENNGKTTIKVDNGINSYEIEYKGEFTLSEDDRDITGLSKGGYFELSKSAFGASRRVKIVSSGGALTKEYFVGPAQRAYEPEGREWLAEILPEVVRSVGLGAESRVNRMFAKGGSKAVMDEIRLLKGDYVRSIYIKLLLEKDLTAKDQSAVLVLTGEVVDSDFHVSEILRNFQRRFPLDETTIDGYLRAAQNIDSDFHKAEVLTSVINNKAVSGEKLQLIIEGTRTIESDFHKSEVLKEVIRRSDLTDSQIGAIIRSSEDLQSGFHLSEVLKELMDKRPLTKENLSLLIEVAGTIDSDFHKSEILSRALGSNDLSEGDLNTLISAIGTMDSDFHLGEVLNSLLSKRQSPTNLKAILELAGNSLHSDHHLSNVLKTALQNQELSGETLAAFLAAIRSLSSDHFLSELIRMTASVRLTQEDLILLVQTCGHIDSDYHRTGSLTALAEKVNASGEPARKAYRDVARGIGSESHYGTAMRALND